MLRLPPETLRTLFSYLCPSSLCSLCLVCHYFHPIAQAVLFHNPQLAYSIDNRVDQVKSFAGTVESIGTDTHLVQSIKDLQLGLHPSDDYHSLPDYYSNVVSLLTLLSRKGVKLQSLSITPDETGNVHYELSHDITLQPHQSACLKTLHLLVLQTSVQNALADLAHSAPNLRKLRLENLDRSAIGESLPQMLLKEVELVNCSFRCTLKVLESCKETIEILRVTAEMYSAMEANMYSAVEALPKLPKLRHIAYHSSFSSKEVGVSLLESILNSTSALISVSLPTGTNFQYLFQSYIDRFVALEMITFEGQLKPHLSHQPLNQFDCLQMLDRLHTFTFNLSTVYGTYTQLFSLLPISLSQITIIGQHSSGISSVINTFNNILISNDGILDRLPRLKLVQLKCNHPDGQNNHTDVEHGHVLIDFKPGAPWRLPLGVDCHVYCCNVLMWVG